MVLKKVYKFFTVDPVFQICCPHTGGVSPTHNTCNVAQNCSASVVVFWRDALQG
jgi:hypothetical protein